MSFDVTTPAVLFSAVSLLPMALREISISLDALDLELSDVPNG